MDKMNGDDCKGWIEMNVKKYIIMIIIMESSVWD